MLIDKRIAEVTKLCSKDGSKDILKCSKLSRRDNSNTIEVTDGWRLARVTHTHGIKHEDFPAVPDMVRNESDGDESFLLNGNELLKVVGKNKSKSSLPILGFTQLTKTGENLVTAVSTDLSTSNTVTLKESTDNFPNTENLIPKAEPKAVFAINPTLLREVLQVIEKLDDNKHKNQLVKFSFYGASNPIRLDYSEENKTEKIEFIGLVMPMRLQ